MHRHAFHKPMIASLLVALCLSACASNGTANVQSSSNPSSTTSVASTSSTSGSTSAASATNTSSTSDSTSTSSTASTSSTLGSTSAASAWGADPADASGKTAAPVDSLTWKRVNSWEGNFSFETAKEWDIDSEDDNNCYPAGPGQEGYLVWLYATEKSCMFPDQETPRAISDLDEQYEFLRANFFLDDGESFGFRYTNITKGTIGGNACVVADVEGLTENGYKKGRKLTFFTSDKTLGIFRYSYEEGYESYDEQCRHSMDSLELADGSKCVFDGGSIPSTPNAGDMSVLDELIKEAETLDKSNYTTDSWKILQDALDTAKDVKTFENPLQSTLGLAAYDLRTAIDNLAPRQ